MSEHIIIQEKTGLNDNFITEINKLVTSGLDYMDSIVYYCEKNNIEIESVVPIIKSNVKIKSGLRIEAENLNFLPKKNRLPI